MNSSSLDLIADDIRQLKRDVHSQGNILKLMMYSQATDFANTVVESLVGDAVLLEIFVRIDAIVPKDALIRAVVDLGLPSGKRASVYTKFARLEDLGLIEPVVGGSRSSIYKKTAISDGLRIEQNPAFLKALKERKGPK